MRVYARAHVHLCLHIYTHMHAWLCVQKLTCAQAWRGPSSTEFQAPKGSHTLGLRAVPPAALLGLNAAFTPLFSKWGPQTAGWQIVLPPPERLPLRPPGTPWPGGSTSPAQPPLCRGWDVSDRLGTHTGSQSLPCKTLTSDRRGRGPCWAADFSGGARFTPTLTDPSAFTWRLVSY